MKKIKHVFVIALFGFGLVVSLVLATQAFAGGDRLECGASGPVDTSMDARYENNGDREKLSISFEAAQGLGFVAGESLDVTVDGTSVGSMPLTLSLEGDIVGDLNFDSGENEPGAEDKPFPVITVGAGDEVRITGVLGCTL